MSELADYGIGAVLEHLRGRDVQCGVQVFSVTKVYAWVGDVHEALPGGTHRMWDRKNGFELYVGLGPNALDDAGRWLMMQAGS
jgi:hypothetical protein